MKKLILGIVAVFSLQIGFVGLTTSDNAREVAVRHLAGEADADPLFGTIEYVETTPDLSTPLFTDEITTFDAPERKSSRSRPAVATRRFRERVGRPRALQASRSNDKVKPAARRQPGANDAVAAKEKPRTEGRSFIAKAAPIIQKPYDWLKAFASKLR